MKIQLLTLSLFIISIQVHAEETIFYSNPNYPENTLNKKVVATKALGRDLESCKAYAKDKMINASKKIQYSEKRTNKRKQP